MEITKRFNLDNIFIFIFLALFPFGQIIKIGIINPIDIVVGFAAFYGIFKGFKKPDFFIYFQDFLLVSVFTFVVSLFLLWPGNLIYGALYLIRLFCYFYFSVYVFHYLSKSKTNGRTLLSSLVLVSIVSAIFGWIQYFKFPDIKPFFIFGWDEHLFRIVGTFLDPVFLSFILIVGIIISPKFFVQLFLVVTLAFTYSRAGYLAFIAAVVSKYVYTKKVGEVFILLLIFGISVLLLPRPAGESVRLERTSSIVARIENYGETIKIIKKFPVFGVGFNNLCAARQKYIGLESFSSHSCSGSDSSILFVLATTGVVGLISLIRLVLKLWTGSGFLFRIALIALFVHSIFGNSVFYPWIMGIMIMLRLAEEKLKV